VPGRAVQPSAYRHIALWVSIILLGAWMLHPILTPAHVEGFSASIVSLALHLNEGHVADYDRLHSANFEYFTLSRLGTVAFVSVLTGPLGLSGDWAMRLMTWLGFVALATSSFVLVRRWTNASGKAVVVALLLIPGLAENSFFYNDTIFAAALGTTALAVIDTSPGFAAAAMSGVLLGAAIVTRLDAALLAPAVMLIGYEQHGLGRAFWSRASVFSLGVIVPVISIPALLHATILDVYAATRYALVLWGDSVRLAQHARELSFFIGIPAGVLAAVGCLGVVRRRDYPRLLFLAGVPTLFNLVALGKIWQSRQLLPLTPFLASLIILGWRHVVSQSHQRLGRGPLEWTVIGVCCFAWFAPILVVRVSDGPRAPYGRLWTPLLWRRWQDAANSNQAEIRTLVEDPRADSTAIITDTWDGDRYLHLALQETGYRQLEGGGAPEPCEKTAETFARGDRRILHIRLHQPFLPNSSQLAAARLATWATPCIAAWRPSRLLRLAPIGQLRRSMSDSTGLEPQTVRARAVASILEAQYSPQLSVDLSASGLESLHRKYLTEAAQQQSSPASRRSPAESLREAERLMGAQVWKARSGIP
jgi:hypothetical protein